MRERVVRVNRPRLVLALAAPAVLAAAGGGSALATAAPAAAAVAAHSPAAPACTDTWVGGAAQPLWTTGSNWSTGKVPGPSSDVCITSTGDDVLTNVSITIHSLRLGADEGIAMQGNAGKPLTATVATAVTLAPGGLSRIDLTDATISAAKISDQGGTIFTDGTCHLASPDITFGDGGRLQAANGTTTVSSLSQLSNGTLTGLTIDASHGAATVVLPGDISHLVSATVIVGAGSAIKDPAGHDALAGLTSIDARSQLFADSALALTGSLTADGAVSIDGPGMSVAGTYTQAQGVLELTGNLAASQVMIGHGVTFQPQNGTIAGNLVNDGTVLAVGTNSVTGNYTQSPGGTIDSIFGAPLNVAGTATLAGNVLGGEPIPVTGNSSPVLTFGSAAGHFTSHNLGFKLVTKTNEIDQIILPQIGASPTTVAPGQDITVSGGSFAFGAVQVSLDNTQLATLSAGYFGRFSGTVTIPSSTSPGVHKLIAVGLNGTRAQITITVN
jgi:hypothetical protein